MSETDQEKIVRLTGACEYLQNRLQLEMHERFQAEAQVKNLKREVAQMRKVKESVRIVLDWLRSDRD